MKEDNQKQRENMKRAVFLLTLMILFTSISSCSRPEEGIHIIEMVQQEFAPDKRVAIFDVTGNVNKRTLYLTGETNLPAAIKSLEEKLTDAQITFVNDIRILPDKKDLKNKTWGVITVSVANIRMEPSNAAEMATQAILGTPVRIYKKTEKGNYYRVQTPDGYLGWIDNNSVRLMDQRQFDAWRDASKVIYLEDHGYVYERPGVNKRVSDLVAGSLLEKIQSVKEYVIVAFPDGRRGVIPDTEVKDFKEWLETRNPTITSILKTSERYMGTPYLWGGASTKMMDCSGFTKTVFFMNGVIIPRDASQQVNEGILLTENVDWLEKVPEASLVFFGRKATEDTPQRVWHVGIWIGNGQMIHEDGPLKIEALDPILPSFNKNRYDTFFSARNYLDALGTGQIVWIKDHEWYVSK